MPSRSTRLEFRELLRPGAAVVLPGVANALAARVVADLGFPAAYVTGAGIANTYLGIPDNGLVTLSELCDHVAAIRDVFPGPIMVDADTGFGNALNMTRTVKMLERAGADAIQIEDQVFPKRCGHFDGKETIPKSEMVAKVKAAADARTDLDTIIVARTDAIATDGFEAALARAAAYREAGADVGFIEAP
jgi:2,3-dimethylmalate lyase